MIEKIYSEDIDTTIFMLKKSILSCDIRKLMHDDIDEMARKIWKEISLLEGFNLNENKSSLKFCKLPDQDPFVTFYIDYNEMMRCTIGFEPEGLKPYQTQIIVDIGIKGKHL